MKRDIRIVEPSPEMQFKIKRARHAISSQKKRLIKCPYCRHNSIVVFEDTRGHSVNFADGKPCSMSSV